jgi:hypothetical protein
VKIPVGIDGIPTSTIPDDAKEFVQWFKSVGIKRWFSNADVRNAIAGSGITIEGDISSPATISSEFAVIPNGTVLGNLSGSPGAPTALTETQVTSLINVATDSLSGALPALSGVATQFLDGVGTWAVPSGGANPTAAVGLSAVNGTASTFTRSDGAPALQQPLEVGDGGTIAIDTTGTTHGIAFKFTYNTGANTAGYIGNGSQFFAGAAMADLGLWCYNGTLRLAFGTSGNTGLSISNAGAVGIPGTLGLSGAGTYGSSWLGNVSTSKTGYTTGSGGAVTQITGRTTGVTLNKICGSITLVSAAGSPAATTFVVSNTSVAATDTIIVNQQSGTDAYAAVVSNIVANAFSITFWDLTGITTEQPVFNFAILKAAAS